MKSFPKSVRGRVGGFSFLEVIISLFVLSIGFLGVNQLSVKTLEYSFLQRDALIASLLAQEGVEGVYQIRDSNIVSGESDIFSGIVPGDRYRIDIGEPSVLSVSGNADYHRLYFDGDNFYKHDLAGAPITKFSRKLLVESLSNPERRRIISMVSWGGDGFPSNVNDCNKSNRCVFSWTELYEND